jgi:hypothetical protein
MSTDPICELVLDACDLVERAADLDAPDEALAEEAGALRAALCSAVTACADDAAAADAHAAVSELDELLARLEDLAHAPATARAA